MKPPIKDPTRKNLSLGLIKKNIPTDQGVDCYFLFAGEIETSLSHADRIVSAHTNNYYVYEFWKCIEVDPQRVHHMVTSKHFSKWEAPHFPLLQESWYTFRDPYMRAAFFYILNRCSSTGRISSGELVDENFHIVGLSRLKSYKKPDNFNLVYHAQKEPVDIVGLKSSSEFIYVPGGEFSYNLFAHGKSRGVEDIVINHRNLKQRMRTIKKPWLINYKYHGAIESFYNKENITMIDGYGRLTDNKEQCEEIIVSNFSLTNTIV
jgi:hypothetical protein